MDIDLVKRYLSDHHLDAVIATEPLTTAYLKNLYSGVHVSMPFTNHPTFVVFPRLGKAFVIDYHSWNPPQEIRPSWIEQYYPGQGSGVLGLEKNLSVLATALRDHGLLHARVGMDLEYLPVHAWKRLLELAPDLEIVPCDALFWQLRGAKNERELGFIKRAVATSETAFLEVLKHAREGALVRELGRIFARAAFGPGTEYRWCSVLSLQPEWFERPPATPNVFYSADYRLTRGDPEPVCFDMGVGCEGYVSDMARALYVGQAPPELEARFEFYRVVQRLVSGLLKPGMSEREVLVATREALRHELGEGFSAAMGLPGIPFAGMHCIGLTAHERPVVSLNEPLELHSEEIRFELNTVFTIEPGYTEDVFVLTEHGVKRLTTLPPILYCV